jgi:hypothetical protein
MNVSNGTDLVFEEYCLLWYNATCFVAGIFFFRLFDPEDGGDMFLQDASWFSMD